MSSNSNPYVVDGKLYGQNFKKLKELHLRSGSLFEDEKFPATESSLYYSRQARGLTWLRPGQLCEQPRLHVDGASRHDINQGELGNCWLLAAFSCLSDQRSKLETVLPPGQSFVTDYAGIFLFRFWQYGEWVEVVVDDFLPCKGKKLAFTHSDSQNEFWSALLEKAYAKLHGAYENLQAGKSCDAMVDFTGGSPQSFALSQLKGEELETLAETLRASYAQESLICCSITAHPHKYEAKKPNGLVMGHAYSVTKVLQLRDGRHFVRVRNPWGDQQEWTGAWSDSSPEWKELSKSDRESFGLTVDTDGEWWMEWKDFVDNFDEGDRKLTKCEWHATWIPGENAGGCLNNLCSFQTNPQYHFRVDGGKDEKKPVIVSLMQKHRRALKDEGKDDLSIGFVIYDHSADYKESQKKLDEKFFRYNPHRGRSDNFVNAREVVKVFSLPTGNYVVIPSTYSPGSSGEFYLRVFTETPPTDEDVKVEDTEDNNSVNLVDMADDKVITIIDQEDKNTTVVEEEGSPPIVKKSMRTNIVTGDVKSDNQVFRIETEFTEITIRVVESNDKND